MMLPKKVMRKFYRWPLFGFSFAVTTLRAASLNPQATIDAWLAGHAGGVAVAIVTESGVTFYQAGQFSATDPWPITPDTQFEIGSVTKVFTALLLAESERLGKVNRDDPAAKFLLPADDPAMPALVKVTLLALATHTSGLPRLPPNFAPANPLDPYADYTLEKLRVALRQSAQSVQAPAAYDYSNYGFSVLGQALAEAWGRPYAEILRERVLDPLGLEKTTLGLPGAPAPTDFAPGHNGMEPVPTWTQDATAPAGGLRSSTRELAKFLQACLDLRDTPLHQSLAGTAKPLCPTGTHPGYVGLAWNLTAGKTPIVWHNGETGGYYSLVAYQPAKKRGIVMLTNSNCPVDAMAIQLLKGSGTSGTKPPAPNQKRQSTP
jgi:D-alanyl-D-alanine-carboxypeptidase/D-alanyl-D-alanine-endopeptidase